MDLQLIAGGLRMIADGISQAAKNATKDFMAEKSKKPDKKEPAKKEPEIPTFTEVEIMTAVKAASRVAGKPAIIEAIQACGASKVPEIPADKMPEFMAAMKKLTEGTTDVA